MRADRRPKTCALVIERRVPVVPPGGASFVDARDAAEGMVLAMERGAAGERYLLTACNITLRELFGRIARMAGVAAPTIPMPRAPLLARAGATFASRVLRRVGAELPVDPVSLEMAHYFWYASSARAEHDLDGTSRPQRNDRGHHPRSPRARRRVARAGGRARSARVSSESDRPLLVVNPKSGGGRTAGVVDDLRAAVERRLGIVDVVLTERSGHAINLAEAAAREDRELVIAVGGDGTFSEVCNGVLRAKTKTHVAFIGQGTGGDFRKTLGIEHRLDKYLDAIASKHERTIDAGRATFRAPDGERTHFFVNILSAGMGGLVDEYVATGSRAFGPTAAYSSRRRKRSSACAREISAASSTAKRSGCART